MQTPNILLIMEEHGQSRCTGICSPLLFVSSVPWFSDLSSFQRHTPHEHDVHMRRTDPEETAFF